MRNLDFGQQGRPSCPQSQYYPPKNEFSRWNSFFIHLFIAQQGGKGGIRFCIRFRVESGSEGGIRFCIISLTMDRVERVNFDRISLDGSVPRHYSEFKDHQ